MSELCNPWTDWLKFDTRDYVGDSLDLVCQIYYYYYYYYTVYIALYSFTKWRIAIAGWSQVSVGKPGCKFHKIWPGRGLPAIWWKCAPGVLFWFFVGDISWEALQKKITEQLLLLLLHASQWLKMFYCQSLRFLVGIRYKVLGFSHFFDDKVKSDQNFRTYTFLTKEVFAVRIPRVRNYYKSHSPKVVRWIGK